MPKGSVVFFTEGLWHWQGDRSEPGERVTLHWRFNRGILRSLEPKRVEPEMRHRNSPRLGEMLGEDEWFDKMDGIGRDHTRFAHMAELHRFTVRQKAVLLREAGRGPGPAPAYAVGALTQAVDVSRHSCQVRLGRRGRSNGAGSLARGFCYPLPHLTRLSGAH